MLKQFQKHINNDFSFLNEGKILVALSGGLDSVVLTQLCFELNLDIHLAHCNFNLRGQESDADETFVLDLAEKLNLEVFVESFDTKEYAKMHKVSIQMAARDLRYNWFYDLAGQLNFDYIVTAHHADDNLETFLINLSRGTGLDGLVGIPEINDKIVRPLLPFNREQILKYAEKKGLQWREDSSNSSTKYIRNKLRHDVIPILKEINPGFLDNFKKSQGHLQESQNIIQENVSKLKESVMHEKEGKILLNIAKIKALPNFKVYIYELLKEYGFSEWQDVYRLLEAQSGKYITSHSYRLIKDREYLIVTPYNWDKKFESVQINENAYEAELSIGKLTFNEVESISDSNSSSIFVDKDLLKYPLTVRKWEKGDYFYPFGMTGKKKLSKYFKDEKWSLPEKEETLLLISNDGKIIWILNNRLDNRFKISENTNQILKISITNET